MRNKFKDELVFFDGDNIDGGNDPDCLCARHNEVYRISSFDSPTEMQITKTFLILGTCLIIGACSVKPANPNASGVFGAASGLQIDPNGDSDGDGVTDADEIKLGRNPFVADLPDLKLQFMKDFTLSYDLDDKSIQVNSQKEIKSQSFDYRVGDITLWNIAKKTTAQFARYDGVVVGGYKDIDLSRISYPYISPKFIAQMAFRQRPGLLKNGNIVFTNTLKLERNKGIQSIVNPVFNFHYFNYETGEYELIAQKKVEKSIYEGVLEKFDIVLDNLPAKLIEENLIQKGEFITTEIEDFEIPLMKTTYKKLLATISDKCIPVTVISPIGTKVYYVTLQSNHNHLGQFLKTIFGSNFKIENNELLQVEGLANNLSKFKLLSELNGKTKEGKWFILFNNKINDDVFQYDFHKGDRVVLNYMTGSELADQSYKQKINVLSKLTSEKNIKDFEIGEVGLNDEVQVGLRSKDLTLDYLDERSYGFNDSGGNSSWVYRFMQQRNEDYSFAEEKIQKRFSLVLNGTEFSLFDLIKTKTVTAVFTDKELKISIPSITQAFSLGADDTYSLLLRVYPENHQEDIGVWLTGIGGWAAGQSGCNSADAVCRSWFTGIPVGLVCSSIQTSNTNQCTGVLKSEYRRKSQTLQRDLRFDASFLIVNKYN
jgi:hypothetical protein